MTWPLTSPENKQYCITHIGRKHPCLLWRRNSTVGTNSELRYYRKLKKDLYVLWQNSSQQGLTHCGRVTHICVSKLTIIVSDNGLSPRRRQAIIWTNAGILLIGPWGTKFSDILVGIFRVSFKKMHLKGSSAKWRPFCLGLNVLNTSQANVALATNIWHTHYLGTGRTVEVLVSHDSPIYIIRINIHGKTVIILKRAPYVTWSLTTMVSPVQGKHLDWLRHLTVDIWEKIQIWKR